MLKQKKKALIKTQSSPAERQFGVILEDLDKKMDTALEGHAALDKKMDDFRYEARSEMGFLKLGQNVLSSNLKDLTVKVDKLGADTKSIFEYLSRMDDELASIRSDITEVKAKILIVSAEKLAELEKRVHAMEAKLASYKSFK